MVRARTVWTSCLALCILLLLGAAGGAAAGPLQAGPALPGPSGAWTWQNPLPQGNSLVALAAVGDRIWAAGATKAIYRSSDRGVTWSACDLDANQAIMSLTVDPETDGQTGWLVTTNIGRSLQADLMRTTDFGATWTALSHFPLNQSVSALFALDAVHLYAGGDSGYVAVSDDGGETWNDVSIPMTDEYSAFVADLSFISETHGFAVTARILYETEDGGATWTVLKEMPRDPRDPFSPRLGSVAATVVRSDEGEVVSLYMTSSQGGAWQSRDHGATWEQSDLGGAQSTFDVGFLNPQFGVIVGAGGKAWATDDAGTEWVPTTLPLEFNLYNVAWTPTGDVIAAGQGGLMARSEDGGITWDRIGSGLPWTLFASTFKDQETGWVVGEAGLIMATRDGSTWTTQRAADESQPSLSAVAFPTYRRGYAVGNDGTILTTTDGGETWNATSSGTEANLWGVSFADRANGWAVGDLGSGETDSPIILATTDGGAHWLPQNVPAGVDGLRAVQFIDDETGWAIGTPGVVLRTTNGGSTWKRSRLAPKANPLDLDFVDGKYGWVCGTIGDGGNFGYHTINGGLTWTRESIPGDVSSAVDFVDRKHGYRVGYFGMVAFTNNGGKTWNFLPNSAPSSYLFDVRMWGDGTGYVVGQFGTIMKTVTGGEGPK